MNTAPLHLLAWRPILDPLPLEGGAWWLLLPPLALGVSMIYKAVRTPDMNRYWRETALMTAQIVGAMLLLAFALHAIVQWIVPALMT
jgi:hypothetical protein